MAQTVTAVVAALLALAWPTFAAAQNEPPATATADRAQEPVEEVVVRGRRTLFSLRRELHPAKAA